MNWQEYKTLALGLRNQGLADGVAARSALRPGVIRILGCDTTLAHLVVAKSQQSVEKLTKGYLLWHSKSFDPTKGHTPFSRALTLPESQRSYFDSLCFKINRLDRRVVAELKWLESLAPHSPELPPEESDNLQPLTIIAENTEYPFWSQSLQELVTTATGLSLENHGVRAIKAVRTFLQAIAKSDPPQFTRGVREFLDDLPFSTAITAWPGD